MQLVSGNAETDLESAGYLGARGTTRGYAFFTYRGMPVYMGVCRGTKGYIRAHTDTRGIYSGK